MFPLRPLLLGVLLALVPASPAHAQEADGSVGGAVAGGLAAGAVALWSFYPLSGCPMITVGAARSADGCDLGGGAAAVAGLGAGVWAGATDSGAGYGLALGAVAGVGAGWLLGRVVDVPRWVNATILLAATTAGGILGAADGDPEPGAPGAGTGVLLVSLPVR